MDDTSSSHPHGRIYKTKVWCFPNFSSTKITRSVNILETNFLSGKFTGR